MLFGKKKDTEVESVGMLSQAEKMGLRISELRRKRNLTQNELAEKLGISFQAVSSWERGMKMPDIMNLKELAGILEVTHFSVKKILIRYLTGSLIWELSLIYTLRHHSFLFSVMKE